MRADQYSIQREDKKRERRWKKSKERTGPGLGKQWRKRIVKGKCRLSLTPRTWIPRLRVDGIGSRWPSKYKKHLPYPGQRPACVAHRKLRSFHTPTRKGIEDISTFLQFLRTPSPNSVATICRNPGTKITVLLQVG